jgi:hypothetical protein
MRLWTEAELDHCLLSYCGPVYMVGWVKDEVVYGLYLSE